MAKETLDEDTLKSCLNNIADRVTPLMAQYHLRVALGHEVEEIKFFPLGKYPIFHHKGRIERIERILYQDQIIISKYGHPAVTWDKAVELVKSRHARMFPKYLGPVFGVPGMLPRDIVGNLLINDEETLLAMTAMPVAFITDNGLKITESTWYVKELYNTRMEGYSREAAVSWVAVHGAADLKIIPFEIVERQCFAICLKKSLEEATDTEKALAILQQTLGKVAGEGMFDYMPDTIGKLLTSLYGIPSVNIPSLPGDYRTGYHKYSTTLEELRGIKEKLAEYEEGLLGMLELMGGPKDCKDVARWVINDIAEHFDTFIARAMLDDSLLRNAHFKTIFRYWGIRNE